MAWLKHRRSKEPHPAIPEHSLTLATLISVDMHGRMPNRRVNDESREGEVLLASEALIAELERMTQGSRITVLAVNIQGTNLLCTVGLDESLTQQEQEHCIADLQAWLEKQAQRMQEYAAA